MSFYLPEERLERLCEGCEGKGRKPGFKGDGCVLRRGMDDGCRKYIAALVKELPIERKANSQGKEFYYVGGDDVVCGIPAELLDKYTNDIVERLRKVTKRIHFEDHSRPIYTVDELENERRMLHIAILGSVGIMPMDISPDAEALKIIIEKFVERRCHDFGVIP